MKEDVPGSVLTPRTQVPATLPWIVASTRLAEVKPMPETFTLDFVAWTVAMPLRLKVALPFTSRATPFVLSAFRSGDRN